MKVYIILNVSLQEFGEFSKAMIEKVFDDKIKAANYVNGKPVAWNEKIDGVNYVCERSITEADVE